MSKSSSLVIVVLEDDRQKMLVYRYLINRGLGPHAIRIERSPSGRGSAESWVRKRFVKEISVYRSRQARTALIVLIDADMQTVHGRLMQLDQALRDSGKRAVDPAERIARLVPRRNIETWILCLNGQAVDEDTDYKRSNDWRQLIISAANVLSEWTRANHELPDYCVASLRLGVTELVRLKL